MTPNLTPMNFLCLFTFSDLVPSPRYLGNLGKLIEIATCDLLVQFATRTGNIEQSQSAYRVGHSTESALLKVKSDLLHVMDNQEVTCLVLLDLSVAFDTAHHDLLLNQLHFRYGFDGIILNWISSYLRCWR